MMNEHFNLLNGYSSQVASYSTSNPIQIKQFKAEFTGNDQSLGFGDGNLKPPSQGDHSEADNQAWHITAVKLPPAGEEMSLEETWYNKVYSTRLEESTVPLDQLNSQFARTQISPNQGDTDILPKIYHPRRGNLSEMERVLKTVKGILNKLTVGKFDVLKGQLIKSGITTPDILEGIVSLIFEKAVLEPTYRSMYALLCSDLATELPRFPSDVPGGKQVLFRRILINICQQTFEGAHNLRGEIRPMAAPEQEKSKLRSLGNIHFICELFKQRMITERIVQHMAVVLLDPDSETFPSEHNLEAIYQIFSNVGKQFDEIQRSRQFNDLYFSLLEELTTNPQLSPRLRFMVLDVLELRARKWCPRPKEGGAALNARRSSFASGIEDLIQNRVPVHPPLFNISSTKKPVPPATRSNTADLHWKTVYLLEEYYWNTVYLLEEYFCVPILDKALQSVKMLKEPEYQLVVVTEAIALALEKNPPCVELVSELLESLFIRNIVTVDNIRIGCRFYGSALDDIGIDLPKAPNNFGEIIGKLVVDGILDFKVVKEVLKLVENDRFRTTIIGAALRSIESSLSEVKASGRWSS